MFQVLDFRSIVAGMINHMRTTQTQITDFHVGGVARTLVEAPAVALDEFYQRVLMGLLEAIPVACYNAFGFEPRPATAAAGYVRFTTTGLAANQIPIAADTVLLRQDSNQRYLVTSNSHIEVGHSYADVAVRAEYAGLDGNAPSVTITTLNQPVNDIASVSNPSPISGGTETETPGERKLRFIEYIGSLSRGTVWSVTYAAKTATLKDVNGAITEYVTKVGLSEGAGQVDVYLYSSLGVPSDALLTVAQNILDGTYNATTQIIVPGYRPVGVRVSVEPMTERTVPVSLLLAMLPGYTYGTATYNAIRDALIPAFAATPPGGIFYIDQIVQAALQAPGVRRALSNNDQNELCDQHEVLTLGELTVGQLN